MESKLTASPSTETLEWLGAGAVEYSKPLDMLHRRLLRLKRGSEPYWETMAEIAVAAEVLKAKLESLTSAIDAAEDGLPD
jgi:hypothetical protein